MNSDNGDYNCNGDLFYGKGDLTAYSRKNVRERVAGDVEAFLTAGGSIEKIPVNVMADPPTKPGNSYGSRPI